MPTYRAYIDKQITDDGTGGEHSRIIDGEAGDQGEFADTLKLEADEQLNQIVELAFPEQAAV